MSETESEKGTFDGAFDGAFDSGKEGRADGTGEGPFDCGVGDCAFTEDTKRDTGASESVTPRSDADGCTAGEPLAGR